MIFYYTQELVNKQELPSLLEAARHKLKQASEKYSSKSALGKCSVTAWHVFLYLYLTDQRRSLSRIFTWKFEWTDQTGTIHFHICSAVCSLIETFPSWSDQIMDLFLDWRSVLLLFLFAPQPEITTTSVSRWSSWRRTPLWFWRMWPQPRAPWEGSCLPGTPTATASAPCRLGWSRAL